MVVIFFSPANFAACHNNCLSRITLFLPLLWVIYDLIFPKARIIPQNRARMRTTHELLQSLVKFELEGQFHKLIQRVFFLPGITILISRARLSSPAWCHIRQLKAIFLFTTTLARHLSWLLSFHVEIVRSIVMPQKLKWITCSRIRRRSLHNTTSSSGAILSPSPGQYENCFRWPCIVRCYF